MNDATKLPVIYHRFADKSKHYITGSFGASFGFVEQGRDLDGLVQNLHNRLMPFGVLSRLYPPHERA